VTRVGGLAFWLALLLALYCGAIHVPFAMQARYTTPVRLLFLAAIATSGAGLLRLRPQSMVAPVRSAASVTPRAPS
jgi:hypothetical protein